MQINRMLYPFIPLLLLSGMAGCDNRPNPSESGMEMLNPYLRAPLPGKTVTVAYMELLNHTGQECHLVGGKAPFAKTIEIHQHTHQNGVMQMRKLNTLTLKPNSKVALAPGGYHLMIFGLNKTLVAGQEYPVTLEFSDCPPVTGRVMVKSVMEQ